MRITILRIATVMLAGYIGVAVQPARAAPDDPVALCDALAASTYDKNAPGGGVPYDRIDAPKAIEACTKAVAARPKEPRLVFQLARGIDKAGRYPEALAKYQAAADAGSIPALHALASMYQYGDGTAQDYAKAFALFKKASDAGFALSTAELGWMTESGQGVPKDDVEAARLHKLAADAGIDVAENNLGVMYETGRGGLPVDLPQAIELYRKAAAQGHSRAAANLAGIFSTGRGTGRDLGEAERLYRIAAEADDAADMAGGKNGLAWIYTGQKRRLDEAVMLARAAVAAAPDDAGYRDTLAYALHLTGKNDEALALQKAVVEAMPKNGNFRARLGDILDALGRHAEAKAAWRRAVALDWDPLERDFPMADYEKKLAAR